MQDSNVKQDKQNMSKSRKIKFSFLSFVLLLCIIELAFGVVQNLSKTISFQSKIKGLENKRNEELAKNKQLKSEVENFNSDMILESIARNNLKMAGEDEVLLIINKPEEEKPATNQKENKVKKNRP